MRTTLEPPPDVLAGAGASRNRTPRGRRAKQHRRSWRRALRRDWQLYSLAVLPLLFFLAVFRYLPMIGNVIAFRRYQPGGSLFGDRWVGLRYFRLFLDRPDVLAGLHATR